MYSVFKLTRPSSLLAILVAINTVTSAISTATLDSSVSQSDITPSTTPSITPTPTVAEHQATVAEHQATVPFQPAICINSAECGSNPPAVKSSAGGRTAEEMLFPAWLGFWYGVLGTALWIFARNIGA